MRSIYRMTHKSCHFFLLAGHKRAVCLLFPIAQRANIWKKVQFAEVYSHKKVFFWNGKKYSRDWHKVKIFQIVQPLDMYYLLDFFPFLRALGIATLVAIQVKNVTREAPFS